MNRNLPFVSVVVPTHNRREYLRELLLSLFEQTYPKDRYEVIIIDNASKDGTGELVESLKAPCVLRYVRKGDEGPGVARNMGISMTRGEIVAFTEDDCVTEPDWIDSGVAAMSEGVGLVQGKTLPLAGQAIRTFSKRQIVKAENSIYQTFNMFYRKKAIEDVGGFSSDFIGLDRFGRPMMGGEDIDLAWKVKKAGWQSAFAGDAVVYHRVFPRRGLDIIANFRRCQMLFYVFPRLARKHPELRKFFFYKGYFLEKNRAFFDLLLFSAVMVVIVHWVFSLFALPYLVRLLRAVFAGRALREYPDGAIIVIVCLLRDFVDSTVLFSGSLWQRSIVF
jgi:glycosyltransferase involved in cell wall biosynthesis